MEPQTTSSLIRPALASVPDYQPGEPPAHVDGVSPYKLSSNEHFVEPLPEVMEALAQPVNPASYPDHAATELVAELSTYLQLPTDHIIVGAGGSEILTALAHITLEAGAEVVYPWPSFEMYPQISGLNGATIRHIALTEDFRHDLPAMADAVTSRTRLILLCSPNNPTGPVISTEDFNAFMARIPADVLVVLDEAYWEFVSDQTAVDGLTALQAHNNLVLVRTFSKAHGLAGYRIGYAVARPTVIDALRKAIVPFGVTQPSQNAALASLRHVDQVMQRAHSIAKAREELVTALRAQGWNVPDTQANFVWLPTQEASTAFEKACVARSLAVRNLTQGVRVSIGPAEAMERLLEVTGSFSR